MRVVPTHLETEDGLRLEAVVRTPDGSPSGSVVICHAHPQHGGLMDHRLLAAIRRGLVDAGFVVVSFNFRGVMGSQGRFGGGVEEARDVRAAIARGQAETQGPMLLCGWSFGARVALRVAVEDERVAALCLIAMSARAPDESEIVVPELPAPDERRRFTRPVLLLVGDRDQYCPITQQEDLARSFPAVTLQVISDADHYFAEREVETGDEVLAFARRALLHEDWERSER